MVAKLTEFNHAAKITAKDLQAEKNTDFHKTGHIKKLHHAGGRGGQPKIIFGRGDRPRMTDDDND